MVLLAVRDNLNTSKYYAKVIILVFQVVTKKSIYFRLNVLGDFTQK
jgi:hypothetical protein